ncbi:MAG: DUF975 family protein [Chitinophagaceae bacterium]|nr:DUF975 family protein [Chitinophagaceae bacterium]
MRPSFDAMKTEALAILDQRWGQAVIAFALIAILQLLLGSNKFLSLLNILLSGAFSLGLSYFFLRLSRQQTPLEASDVFSGFKRYGDALFAGVLIGAIVLLGVVLLIVPGIIAALALSQTYNIMNDNPNMSVPDAMRKSHELMKGHRTDYFLFNLSFFGWALLCILTLGLGFLILGPYISTSNAVYYNYLIAQTNQAEDVKDTEIPPTPSDFDQQFKDITASYRNEAE